MKTEPLGLRRRSGQAAQAGLKVPRLFSTQGVDPFEQINWERRSAAIKDDKGKIIFEQEDVEVPADLEPAGHQRRGQQVFLRRARQARAGALASASWSTASRGPSPTGRKQDGLFASDADAERFYDELTWLCVNQYGAFNSPVWFNVGLFHQYGHRRLGRATSTGTRRPTRPGQDARAATSIPQASACFIQSRRRHDGRHHAPGHGRGHALQVRLGHGHGPVHAASSREKLSGGGKPSGPLSFMRVFDQIAGGGQVRRQDPPGRQDAVAPLRPPGHQGVHRVQDAARRRRPGR